MRLRRGFCPAHPSPPLLLAGITILPVLSASTPRVPLTEGQARALMARIQDAGTEVVKVRVVRRVCIGGDTGVNTGFPECCRPRLALVLPRFQWRTLLLALWRPACALWLGIPML